MREALKVCALCRHLALIRQGREFEQIADTEYAVFRCTVLGWTTREDYLMAPVLPDPGAGQAATCPHWEGWSAEGEGGA